MDGGEEEEDGRMVGQTSDLRRTAFEGAFGLRAGGGRGVGGERDEGRESVWAEIRHGWRSFGSRISSQNPVRLRLRSDGYVPVVLRRCFPGYVSQVVCRAPYVHRHTLVPMWMSDRRTEQLEWYVQVGWVSLSPCIRFETCSIEFVLGMVL